MKNLSHFEKSVQYSFKDKDLLQQAFVHRSYLNEHRGLKIKHNERLEFLGDAVLELVVTDFLYSTYPDHTEGELTSYRAALVNTGTLSGLAAGLTMDDYLLLSKGESRDTGRARQYILANTFEAVIGALYLDGGYEAAREFIAAHLFPLAEEVVEKRLWQDAKSHFQEKAQEKAGITPEYRTEKQMGPDHDKRFFIGVFLGGERIAEGEGKSKQEAEQDAAEKALKVKQWT